MSLPNRKVFPNEICYAHRNHEDEGPAKILATLELVYYIQCVGSLKTQNGHKYPPPFQNGHKLGEESSTHGDVPIKLIHVLQTPHDVHSFPSPQHKYMWLSKVLSNEIKWPHGKTPRR